MESIWIHHKIIGNGGLILSRTHLLIINYAMDEKSQVFSHQVDLVNKLAEKYDKVYLRSLKREENKIAPELEPKIDHLLNNNNQFEVSLHVLCLFISVHGLALD